MRSAKKAAILGVMLFVTAAVVHAQTAVGEVNGTVSDKSGAIVAGATVKLTNQATGIVDKATTNSDGHFFFINVNASYIDAKFGKTCPCHKTDIARTNHCNMH